MNKTPPPSWALTVLCDLGSTCLTSPTFHPCCVLYQQAPLMESLRGASLKIYLF